MSFSLLLQPHSWEEREDPGKRVHGVPGATVEERLGSTWNTLKIKMKSSMSLCCRFWMARTWTGELFFAPRFLLQLQESHGIHNTQTLPHFLILEVRKTQPQCQGVHVLPRIASEAFLEGSLLSRFFQLSFGNAFILYGILSGVHGQSKIRQFMIDHESSSYFLVPLTASF